MFILNYILLYFETVLQLLLYRNSYIVIKKKGFNHISLRFKFVTVHLFKR